jgi:alkylhydroperoxidase family enzyme
MSRIDPVAPPYTPEVDVQLASMMPPGTPPILLFRTFVTNMEMTKAMATWGGYELSRRLSITLRDREILINRTCARCGCEYEWGVHVAFFAERAALSRDQVASLTSGGADDPCWVHPRDRALVAVADSLHDHASVDDAVWTDLRVHFSDEQLLDVLMLCGWYHAISFTARAARVPLELGVPTFAEAAPAPGA